jgi:hypothetical protein
MMPMWLAKEIVEHFRPTGRILEPCKGTGNFLNVLPEGTLWCEITEGRDFFDFHEKVDWIVTNCPWGQVRAFLKHSMELADNVVLLMTINHVWTKSRLRDIKDMNFGIREIYLVPTPKEFPQLGFQLGGVHFQKSYSGPILFNLNDEIKIRHHKS